MSNQVFAETGESIFTSITRLSVQHGALNLGQGFPNFMPPPGLVRELQDLEDDYHHHQYAPSSGVPELRKQLARLYREWKGLEYDPETEITVTSGGTEALAAALYGLLNPGDEVLVFEPVYDLYRPVARRAGATVRSLPLREPEFRLPVGQLRDVVDDRTDLIVVNHPHNPTGRVFERSALRALVDLARRHDVQILSDEVYENLYFEEERPPVPLPSLEGARSRTLRVGSAGKLMNATGWKIGWICGPPEMTRDLRRAHQYTTFCASRPLQAAVARFLSGQDVDDYLASERTRYARRRTLLMEGLRQSPFDPVSPQGTYFALARIPGEWLPESEPTDLGFVRRMIREYELSAIPVSPFCPETSLENPHLRFAFCKKREQLEQAIQILTSMEKVPGDRGSV